MKISRKLQMQFEAKIRHSIATGPLPRVEPRSVHGTSSPHESPKADTQDKDQAK